MGGEITPSCVRGRACACLHLLQETGGERSCSEGNFLIFLLFFFSDESSAFLVRIGAASRSCGGGQGRADLNSWKGTSVSPSVGQGWQADLLSGLKSERLHSGSRMKPLQPFLVFLQRCHVRASQLRGRRAQAGFRHTALLPAGCPPRPWSSPCFGSLGTSL